MIKVIIHHCAQYLIIIPMFTKIRSRSQLSDDVKDSDGMWLEVVEEELDSVRGYEFT